MSNEKAVDTKPTEAKAATAVPPAPEPIPLPRYPVDSIVLYQTSEVSIYAKVKNSRMLIRPRGKSDTQWQYLLDVPDPKGWIPEQFLFKVK
jgi:hypothetical protein